MYAFILVSLLRVHSLFMDCLCTQYLSSSFCLSRLRQSCSLKPCLKLLMQSIHKFRKPTQPARENKKERILGRKALFMTQNASFIPHWVGYCAMRQVSGPLPLSQLIPTEWLQAGHWPSRTWPFYGSSVGKHSFKRGLARMCVYMQSYLCWKWRLMAFFSFPVCCLCQSWSVKSICAGERQHRQMCSDRWEMESGISCHFCWLE